MTKPVELQLDSKPLFARVTKSFRHFSFAILAFAQSNQLQGAWQVPLSDNEIATATAIATNTLSPIQQNQHDLSILSESEDFRRSTKTDITEKPFGTHPLGKQILLVELKERKKPSTQNERLAEVFVFDYQRGVTELSVINIQQNRLLARQLLTSVHLPLAEAEISHSRFLVWNNAEIRQRIKNEIIATGQVLTGAAEQWPPDLQMRVSIWVPNSTTQAGASHCVYERCALISLFTADHYNFTIEPVVNLMRGQVYIDLIQ